MHLFLRQLKWELSRLLHRRRTYLAFGVLVVFELLLLTILQFDPVRSSIRNAVHHAGYSFDANFSGLTLAAYMMGHTMVLGNCFVALVTGEILAGEAEDGTLRMIFCRPVARRFIFAQKLLVCALYTTAVTWFIGGSALAVGLIFEGPGNLLIWSFQDELHAWFEFQPGLERYCLAVGLMNLSMFSLCAVAFAFSCFDLKPAAATVLTLTLFLADNQLREMPQLRVAKPYFVMTRFVTWLRAYADPIPWPEVARNYSMLFAFNTGLLGLGYWRFCRRDLKR